MAAIYREWVTKYGKNGQLTFYKPVGCEKCGGSGFKGRCGLHELLIATEPIKKLIAERARVAEILAVALEEGMRTLKQDGMEKCLMGVTHIKEVRAVCIK
jgi:type II secretory ATPase GspE/PulE/Tfp pilus assembly ATPase PilB-like protein